MVFTKIQFIRGVVVSDQSLRVLIGYRFNNLWQLWKKTQQDYKNDEEDRDCAWNAFLFDENGMKILSEKLGLCIYTWPCCSKLNGKKFVIGVKYDEAVICVDIFESVTPIPVNPSYLDREIRDKIVRYGDCLDIDIQSVMVLDDCVRCD